MPKGKGTAPAAFLASAKRMAFKPGRPGYRICRANKRDGTKCGMLALKDLPVCAAHGGRAIQARRGQYKPTGKDAAYRATKPEAKPNLPSFELMKTQAYRQADQKTRQRMAQTQTKQIINI